MGIISGGNVIEGAAERIRRVSVELDDGDGAGELLAWQNPESVRILIVDFILDLTTKSTSASTADFGVAADGTTSDDSLLDGSDTGTAAAVFRVDSPAIALDENGGTTDWITGSEATGDVTGLAGRVHIFYVLDE